MVSQRRELRTLLEVGFLGKNWKDDVGFCDDELPTINTSSSSSMLKVLEGAGAGAGTGTGVGAGAGTGAGAGAGVGGARRTLDIGDNEELEKSGTESN